MGHDVEYHVSVIGFVNISVQYIGGAASSTGRLLCSHL